MRFRGILFLLFGALLAVSCTQNTSNPADSGGTGYTVAGRVLSYSGAGAADVLVKITGISGRDSVHTDAEGRFFFHDVLPGVWLVTLSGMNLTFNPENIPLTVSAEDITLADVTAYPGSGSLAEHAGANQPVTILNVVEVASLVNTLSLGVFQKAIAPFQADPAAMISLLGSLALTANGAQAGSARITGTLAPVLSGLLPTGFSTNLNTAWFDYSDDGQFFIGGSTVFSGGFTYGSSTFPLHVAGEVRFNGSFAGAETYTADFTVNPLTGEAPYTVTLTMTSGGVTFQHTFSGTARLPVMLGL